MITHKCKKIIFTIDSDYLELVESIGLDYSKFGSDLKIKILKEVGIIIYLEIYIYQKLEVFIQT